MFERFTERARQVVVLAQEEARTHNHAKLEIPHLIQGLLREESGIAAQVLRTLGIKTPSYEGLPVVRVGPLPERARPLAADAKRALELALREALALGHNYIGTEHILLGILRVSDEGALTDIPGVTIERIHWTVIAFLTKAPPSSKPQPSSASQADHALAVARSAIQLALDALKLYETLL